MSLRVGGPSTSQPGVDERSNAGISSQSPALAGCTVFGRGIWTLHGRLDFDWLPTELPSPTDGDAL